MEPFYTARRLAPPLIREQVLEEVCSAMHSVDLKGGNGRPRREKGGMHTPPPENQGSI